MTREFEFWTPEPIWKGEICFILASGPSMTQETADRLRDRNVIVVNVTYRLAPWAPVWFFTDTNIFENYRADVESWPGLVVTFSRVAKRELPDKIRRVHGEWMPSFPPLGSPVIRQGRSTGQTAISLAIALGATLIILLGFDMQPIGGREHHHDEYRDQVREPEIYDREFIPAFKGWNKAAEAMGVQIFNATPNSALTEFPMIELNKATH